MVKMNKQKLNTRLYAMYLIAFVPLILYGLYKNGIELYKMNLVGIFAMLKPIIILFMSLSGAALGGLFREYKKDKKIDFETLKKCKGDIVEAVLIAAILPLASSPLVVLPVSFASSFFLNKLKINRVCLEYLAIEGLNVLFGLNTFANAYEATRVLNYDAIDLFFGLGPGGIFATSILFISIGLLFLSFNKLYKKETVYAGIIAFVIATTIPAIISGNYVEIMPRLFGYNALFSIVFIAPNLYSSSYTVKGQIASGALIGILTVLLYYITPYTAVIIAILFVSLTKNVIDRFFVIK